MWLRSSDLSRIFIFKFRFIEVLCVLLSCHCEVACGRGNAPKVRKDVPDGCLQCPFESMLRNIYTRNLS